MFPGSSHWLKPQRILYLLTAAVADLSPVVVAAAATVAALALALVELVSASGQEGESFIVGSLKKGIARRVVGSGDGKYGGEGRHDEKGCLDELHVGDA